MQMAIEPTKGMDAAYMRKQAVRCEQLSRSCMDLGAARDLRLMAQEYFGEARKLEADIPAPERH